MKKSEFSKLVDRYRSYDNRSLIIALAESYGRRDAFYSGCRYCRDALAVLKLSSDTEMEFHGMELGLKLAVKYLCDRLEYEDNRAHAIRNVMEGRNFRMSWYCCCDFPVPDNWDMLDKSNPEYPPLDIEGVTK